MQRPASHANLGEPAFFRNAVVTHVVTARRRQTLQLGAVRVQDYLYAHSTKLQGLTPSGRYYMGDDRIPEKGWFA